MKEEEFKILAFSFIGLLGIVAIYPTLVETRALKPFSELGILGPNKTLSDYPRNVVTGQNFTLYIYLANHEGEVTYYRVLAKVGNENSTVSDSSPMNAAILNSWDFIIMNGYNTTIPVKLAILTQGQNQRIVFELYKYDSSSNSFTYYNRWTQIWVNVTVN
jgi:uncharacterized membrane protein